MFRLISILIVITISLISAKAQQVAVQSCSIMEQDCTATDSLRYDLNGDLTTVVKFHFDKDCTPEFRGNIIGKPIKRESEWIIYLTGRTRKIYVYMDNSLPIEIDFTKFKDSTKGLLAGKTYLVELKTSEQRKLDFGKGSNVLVFNSDAPLSKLIVNGQEWQVDGNTFKRLMPYGEYEYSAYSESQKKLSGTVVVKNTLGNTIVKLKFKE